MQFVTVAVLPPRLPADMAPPTGLGMANSFSWDEPLNWRHNQPLPARNASSASGPQQQPPPQARRKSSWLRKSLSVNRTPTARNPDKPPFVMRQVPYEMWRKHYAKDKDGNYKGLLAPAQDCLLKPEDIQKWRADDPVTYGDKWTRGQHALPVYAEAGAEQPVPEYQVDAASHDQPVSYDAATAAMGNNDHLETWDGSDTMRETRSSQTSNNIPQPPARTKSTGQVLADDKTADQIIAEAKAKSKPKMTMKQYLSKGATMAMMGN